MQACRALRSSARLSTGASTSHVRLARFASPAVDLDHPADAVHVAGDPRALRGPDQPPTRERVSTLLQKTVALLPHALSTADDAPGPTSALFWSNILERSILELSSGSDQLASKVTVTVCGFDRWSGSHDLVTALLDDPFSSDPTYTDILRSRWANAPGRVNIEYGKPTACAGRLFSPSDWLQRFPHAIQLTELPNLVSLSSISNETDSLLLNSDILLLLSDPVVTPLSDLTTRAGHLLNKPNTVLVLTSGSASDSHRQFVSRTLSWMECQPGHILFVDPRQALDAVIALQANSTSPPAIDRYQRDTLGSRLSTVTTTIGEILSPESPSKASLTHLRLRTALSQVYGALSAGFRSLEATERDAELVASKVGELSSQAQRIRENASHDILGKPGEDNKIERALSLGAKEMNTLLGSLTFWKMVWRVDEISAFVSAAVQGQWCKGLEDELILLTGHLGSVKAELSTAAFALVSGSSSTSLRSFVLENRLQQLHRLPAHALTPHSLTQPIHNRRSQLVQHTTARLHREAQNAVIGASGGMLGGAGLGWWLTFGEHILSLGAGAEMGTALGSSALVAVIGFRWAVGKWERAKRRWAQDLGRIGEGLTRDLENTIQRTVDDNVTIVALTACRGVQDLVDRRRDETRELRGKLRGLDTELRACVPFPATCITSQGLPLGREVQVE